MQKREIKTYSIQTFGCQMNQSDSERFDTFLQANGLNEADHWQKADVIVLNTCSVKQKAEDRINGVVNNIRALTLDTNPLVVLTGCMARRIWDDSKQVQNSSQKSYAARLQELQKIFPKVDIIIETKDFPQIGEKLGFKREFNEDPEHYLSFKPKYKSKFQAYVPISTGCNHFCTFCIVPFARGKEVCRPAEEIIREVFDLINNGYKDVTLLGQTVNRWINPNMQSEFVYNEALTQIETLNSKPLNPKDLETWKFFFETKINNEANLEGEMFTDLPMPRDFLQLIQVLDQIPGNYWTTWLSSHPNYMSYELIDFVAESVKSQEGHQRPYLHFALQSGSDKMLKIMNRRHSIEEFKNIVKNMDRTIPELSLSTDIIVGFPRESEEDFLQTIEIEKELGFDMIYISEFSPRKGTAAARIPNDIPNELKAERKDRLNEVLKQIAKIRNSRFLNKQVEVLVDSLDRKTGFLRARTIQNKPVVILDCMDESLIGSFVKVKLIKAGSWSFEGTLI